ncbi:MAG TPA: MmgE/PrpD family protein, partial [Streptomyces sp.]
MTAPMIERIADRICGIQEGELPADVLEKAKLCVLDQLGIQLWAASLPKLAPVLALAESMADPEGSTVALLSHRVR